MDATISAAEFKAHCLQLMDEVAATGESLVITKRGRPVAKLAPVNVDLPEFGCMKDKTRIVGDLLAPIGEVWNADA